MENTVNTNVGSTTQIVIHITPLRIIWRVSPVKYIHAINAQYTKAGKNNHPFTNHEVLPTTDNVIYTSAIVSSKANMLSIIAIYFILFYR